MDNPNYYICDFFSYVCVTTVQFNLHVKNSGRLITNMHRVIESYKHALYKIRPK